MQGAEGAGVVELCEIDLIGEAGGAPIALLGGVPAMARVATKRNKQQITLIKSRLQVRRNLLVKCPSKCKYHGVMPFEQVVQNLFFEWGVKAADDDFIGLDYFVRPASGEFERLGWCITRSEECHQLSVKQVLISG